MIFTVTWLPSALNDLARIWTAALDRDAVTWASGRIDIELRVDGHIKGIPFQGFRLLEISPLMAKYWVSEDDRLIEVVEIKRSPSGNGHV